ncbi:MAG: AmmeMemoRadiSam system protein B [Mariprofundaceae bacterium]
MNVRSAAVANLFYPGDVGELSALISTLLESASSERVEKRSIPKAIIVPHAGYIYSGLTAAFAYQMIKGAAIDRVVLFGPAHRAGAWLDNLPVPGMND